MKSKSTEVEQMNEDYHLKLDGVFKNVNEWLKFAEQKNASLLLLNGGMIWGVTRVLSAVDFVPKISYWLNMTGYSLVAVSTLICIISFLPILQQRWFKPEKPSPSDNCLYFAHSAKYDARDYLKLLAKKLGYEEEKTTFTEFEVDLSKQIVTNSEIAFDKYKRFKLSAIFTISAVVLFLLSFGIINFME
ncbi:Pycsar system effector family protein [Vreelandella profundi]|uniref:Pycsar system effector family protein n=1 Tax=Vreelandella profundi TaxID=2852117 RepID=UPI001EF0DD1F|nr:Pycsar system effector family protein [Halomonas profundi]